MKFDAQKFADWLQENYRRSSFKSQAALAKEIGISRQYMSRLMRGVPQDVGHPPTQPSREIVGKLCVVFFVSFKEGMQAAGYSDGSTYFPNKPDEKFSAQEIAELEKFIEYLISKREK